MPTDQENTGDFREQWIIDAISNVRNGHTATDPSVFTTLEALLQRKISDRDLTPANLREVANTLIEAFVPNTTEPETKNED